MEFGCFRFRSSVHRFGNFPGRNNFAVDLINRTMMVALFDSNNLAVGLRTQTTMVG